jgi:hypothetical protein
MLRKVLVIILSLVQTTLCLKAHIQVDPYVVVKVAKVVIRALIWQLWDNLLAFL